MSDFALSAGPLPAPAGLLSAGERRSLGTRLLLALITAGLLMLSVVVRWWWPDRDAVAELVAGAAALLVAVPAFSAAWHSLRYPDLHGMTDLLVALAVIAAFAAGDLFTAALLPLVMTVGHILEERSLLGSTEAIRALSKLTETRARRRLADGAIEVVAADRLRLGDAIELRPGDRVPADGRVRVGRSMVDSAPITGESVPIEVGAGDTVFAGAINLDGLLDLEVTRVGNETALGRVVALMQDAELAKPPVTRLLERYAGSYLVLVLLIATGSWFATESVSALLAVIVASCPCALVLAAPATSVAAIAVASRHGILVKGAAFLEQLATVDSVVFDKTGTLTVGELRLVAAEPVPGVERADLIRVAGSLGAASNHPVARALTGLVPVGERLALDAARESQGLGVVAGSGDAMMALGRPELFADLGIAAPAPPAHDGPIAGVSRGAAFLGWMRLADEARPEAREALADLAGLGLHRQLLLTGDRASVARRVADELGIEDVVAEALPDQKLDSVLAETRAGHRPMVVGDGINDSLALKAGAVGVAMGAGGADLALASADIVLLGSDLRRLGTAIRLSRRCRRTIHTNVGLGLLWTAGLIAVGSADLLGASGALVAAVLHNVGTLLVMMNAGRLLRFQER